MIQHLAVQNRRPQFEPWSRNRPRGSQGQRRHFCLGFTLVELLVVIAIVGIVLSLSLHGVNASREAMRRTQCSNHMRQLVLGLHNFHGVHKRFPFGNDRQSGLSTSWITRILPQIEQQAIYESYDLRLPADDPKNLVVTDAVVATVRCPSSILDVAGDTDYAGILGSALASPTASVGFDLNNGVMIESSTLHPQPIAISDIFDGSSQTICIAEVVDRLPEQAGRWSDGQNCISHDNGGINVDNSGEIFSFHPGGANVALSDGAVRFLSESVSLEIIGGLCSRRGQEDVRDAFGPP